MVALNRRRALDPGLGWPNRLQSPGGGILPDIIEAYSGGERGGPFSAQSDPRGTGPVTPPPLDRGGEPGLYPRDPTTNKHNRQNSRAAKTHAPGNDTKMAEAIWDGVETSRAAYQQRQYKERTVNTTGTDPYRNHPPASTLDP
ncbi:Hypothetical predicted protein [Pelobates cultripes]|uniref:Uncharacterized protein n=1 Tax=Pelobates cultripes TaxID=61616 RepID=A0AAD1WAB4_PELCU|nr:Hypothetical predicted protein [Pelobates cultripes]